MFTNFLAHQTSKLVVDGMTRTSSHDTTLDRFADKCHITNDIKELMAGTFVFPHQRLVLDVANLLSIHVRNVKYVCKLIKFLLSYLALIDNNSVIQIAALYKVCFKQRYDIANKHECTSWRNLLAKVANIVESCKLAIDELRLERAHSCDGELLIW